jgi:hypothetical protein
MKLYPARPAVAMIELIFAIVIMGIALMSAPMLVSTASTSSQVTFQQESIAMIASHTNALLSYAWDEQDTESVNNYTILDTNSPTAALNNRSTISSLALGKLRILPGGGAAMDATQVNNFGPNENGEIEPDDIDDFNGSNTALSTIAAVSQIIDGDYLDQNISISTQIAYANGQASSSDFSTCQGAGNGCAFSQPVIVGSGAGTRNVKFITTTLTSINIPDKTIVLQGFMCNIGTATPRRREGI